MENCNDEFLCAQFIGHLKASNVPLDISGHKTRFYAELSNVIGTLPQMMSCEIKNGSWNFHSNANASTAIIPHRALKFHKLM